ncbi:MAG TPA: M43 family zinc metalloprotease [Solirubrobacteraceae bacterium]|nr:M43 family zinc metalloprotease [Solirubrobacteraceae bacterium]
MADVPPRRKCGALDVHRLLLNTDPEYAAARSELEDFTDTETARGLAAAAPKVRTIPTVVHVVYKTAAQNISDAQVKSQIDVLNEDFRKMNADAGSVPSVFQPLHVDTMVQFKLATKDIFGNSTTGITRTKTNKSSFGINDGVKSYKTGGIDPWPARRYLNIWCCNLGGGLLGYAQFPGGPWKTDGVVILCTAFGNTGTATDPFDLGRTATHEVGHWLNLFHIWGDDGTGCKGSDMCPDTPNQASENFGKPTFPHISCKNGPNGDMFMNYMDYVDDDAMMMFTDGQATRMNAALNGRRKLLFQALPKFPGNLGPSKTKKPAVKKLQVELRDRYNNDDLKADGVYGKTTEAAVRRFQENRKDIPWKLPVNGKVGKKTWIAIFA